MAGIITIDGSQGEGGGQVLRSSLALSLVTGRPLVIEKIRAGRKKPGLLRQHLTAVLAAAEVSGAEVEGAALGSRRLVFRPGPVRSGNYAFRVGTAGSATLVLQTVLPALLAGRGRVEPDPGRRHAQSHGPAGGFPGEGISAAGEPAGAAGRGAACPPGLLSGRRRGVHRPRPAGAAARPPGTSQSRPDHRPPGPRDGGQPAAAHRRAGVPDHRPADRLGRRRRSASTR